MFSLAEKRAMVNATYYGASLDDSEDGGSYALSGSTREKLDHG